GAWFHFSSELDAKEKMIDSLKGRKTARDNELNGTTTLKGVIKENDNPIDGLKMRAEAAAVNASKMWGTEDGDGANHRVVLFEQKQTEIDAKLEEKPGHASPVQAKWKALYDEWAKLNGDINESVKKLKGQNV